MADDKKKVNKSSKSTLPLSASTIPRHGTTEPSLCTNQQNASTAAMNASSGRTTSILSAKPMCTTMPAEASLAQNVAMVVESANNPIIADEVCSSSSSTGNHDILEKTMGTNVSTASSSTTAALHTASIEDYQMQLISSNKSFGVRETKQVAKQELIIHQGRSGESMMAHGMIIEASSATISSTSAKIELPTTSAAATNDASTSANLSQITNLSTTLEIDVDGDFCDSSLEPDVQVINTRGVLTETGSSMSIRSVGSMVCRICHTAEEPETLISPCLCKGSLTYVHIDCLERWISTSRATSCELCQFQFNIRSKLRYGCFESLRMWYSRPISRRALQEDCQMFSLLTLVAFGIIGTLLAGFQHYFMPSRNLSIGGIITRSWILFFLFTTLIVYFINVYMIVRSQLTPWYRWWQSAREIHLVLENRKPFKLRSKARRSSQQRNQQRLTHRDQLNIREDQVEHLTYNSPSIVPTASSTVGPTMTTSTTIGANTSQQESNVTNRPLLHIMNGNVSFQFETYDERRTYKSVKCTQILEKVHVASSVRSQLQQQKEEKQVQKENRSMSTHISDDSTQLWCEEQSVSSRVDGGTENLGAAVAECLASLF